eukprot:8943409-Pyramimonas_sp.AAC.1
MRTPPLGPSVETSYGATKCCTGRGKRMRTPLLGRSIGSPVGPQSAVLGGGSACGHRHWGRRRALLMGPRNVVLGVWEKHANHATGVFQETPYEATERVRDVPKWTGCGM